MITKTYICDLCNASVGENELMPLSISINIPKSSNGHSRNLTAKKDCCSACLSKKGLLLEPDAQTAEQVAKNEKTLEQKFIDLLEALGVQFQE